MHFIFNEDSNLYGYADGEFEFPSNIKQMGCIDGDIKIYMEDYVYTYLCQFARTGGNKEKLAALVGRHMLVEGHQVIIISGAIQGKKTIQQKGVESFTDETWNYINTQISVYFSGLSLVGWVHTQPGFGAFLMSRDEIFHKEYFKNDWQVLYVIDPLDKMDTFFVHNNEKTALRPAKGYFIYYEKNESMQEYMLDNSLAKPKLPSDTQNEQENEIIQSSELEKRRPSPEERMDAAKKIRKVLKNRAEEAEVESKKRYSILTGISSILCVVCLFMGISLMNNLDRIRKLETEVITVKTSYSNILESINKTNTAEAFASQNETSEETKNTEEIKKTEEIKEPNEAAQSQTEQKKEENTTEQAQQIQEEAPKTQPEAVQAQTEVKKEPEIYIVEEGDNLGYISIKFYGTKKMVGAIMMANEIEDPDKIHIGEKLILPNP